MNHAQRKFHHVLLGATALVVPFHLALAQAEPPSVVRLSPAEMQWKPFGLTIERTLLSGNSSASGCPSSVRSRLQPGTRIQPHALEQDESFTVISGTLLIGIGEQWDDAKLRAMPPDSFIVVPAGVSSFKTSPDEVVYQVSVIGPGGDACGGRVAPVQTVMLKRDEMKWQAWGATAERAILAGDPRKTGCPYTDRVKFAPNTRVPAHVLPEDKTYTVISGTIQVGFGDTFDEDKLVRMGPGSFWAVPGNGQRFFKTDGEVIFQSSVTGPLHAGCTASK